MYLIRYSLGSSSESTRMVAKDVGRVAVWALLREARRRSGLTRAELADRASTSRAAITRYETARAMPSIATLDRIVRACGLELGLTLEPRSSQREAAVRAAAGQSVEDRLLANESAAHLVHELGHG